MLKEYQMPDGSTWQYEEGEQPSEAVEVKPEPKPEKAPAKKGK